MYESKYMLLNITFLKIYYTKYIKLNAKLSRLVSRVINRSLMYQTAKVVAIFMKDSKTRRSPIGRIRWKRSQSRRNDRHHPMAGKLTGTRTRDNGKPIGLAQPETGRRSTCGAERTRGSLSPEYVPTRTGWPRFVVLCLDNHRHSLPHGCLSACETLGVFSSSRVLNNNFSRPRESMSR